VVALAAVATVDLTDCTGTWPEALAKETVSHSSDNIAVAAAGKSYYSDFQMYQDRSPYSLMTHLPLHEQQPLPVVLS